MSSQCINQPSCCKTTMSSHLFDDREASPSDLDDPGLDEDVQLILRELRRKPGFRDVIEGTRAWSRDAWFTSDGVRFYHRLAGAYYP